MLLKVSIRMLIYNGLDQHMQPVDTKKHLLSPIIVTSGLRMHHMPTKTERNLEFCSHLKMLVVTEASQAKVNQFKVGWSGSSRGFALSTVLVHLKPTTYSGIPGLGEFYNRVCHARQVDRGSAQMLS